MVILILRLLIVLLSRLVIRLWVFCLMMLMRVVLRLGTLVHWFRGLLRGLRVESLR